MLLSSAPGEDEWEDFSNASDWESLTASVEHTLTQWGVGTASPVSSGGAPSRPPSTGGATQADSVSLLPPIESTVLGFDGRSFKLTLYRRIGSGVAYEPGLEHLPAPLVDLLDTGADFPSRAHRVQRQFGVKEFVVLAPIQGGAPSAGGGRSGGGDDENAGAMAFGALLDLWALPYGVASALLSAVSLALANVGASIPAFVPVSDTSKGAYIGHLSHPGVMVRFATDTRDVDTDKNLQHLAGIMDLFREKLPADGGPAAGMLPPESEDASHVFASARFSWVRNTKALPLPTETIRREASGRRSPALPGGGAIPPRTYIRWQSAPMDDLTAVVQASRFGPLWAPPKDFLSGLHLSAFWPHFRENVIVDNDVFSGFIPMTAPVWHLRVTWSHGSSVIRSGSWDRSPGTPRAASPTMELAPSSPTPVRMSPSASLTPPQLPRYVRSRPIANRRVPAASPGGGAGYPRVNRGIPVGPDCPLAYALLKFVGIVRKDVINSNNADIFGPGATSMAELGRAALTRHREAVGSEEAAAQPMTAAPGGHVAGAIGASLASFLAPLLTASGDLPPFETRLQDIMVELFGDGEDPELPLPLHHPTSRPDGEELVTKSAPPGSLCALLALRLVLKGGSFDGVSALWSEFVARLHRHWDTATRLPHMSADLSVEPPPPEFGTSLLHQKLVMLDLCIHRRAELRRRHTLPSVSPAASDADSDGGGGWDDAELSLGSPLAGGSTTAPAVRLVLPPAARPEVVPDSDGDDDLADFHDARPLTADSDGDDEVVTSTGPLAQAASPPPPPLLPPVLDSGDRLGVKSTTAMTLLETGEPLCIPLTQDPPAMCEDAVMTQQAMFARLGASAEASKVRQALQSSSLISDMSAFKAANPGAVLEDFVRWHSPRDWVQGDDGAPGGLSTRMQGADNMWHKAWKNAPCTPAAGQRALFDVSTEAEKALHFFDSLEPSQVLLQLLAVVLSPALHLVSFVDAELAVTPAMVRSRLRTSKVASRAAVEVGHHSIEQLTQKCTPMMRSSAVDTPMAVEALSAVAEVARATALDLCAAVDDAAWCLADTETIAGRGLSLRHRFPGHVELVTALMDPSFPDIVTVQDTDERAVVADLLLHLGGDGADVGPSAPIVRRTMKPEVKEFVLRTQQHRSFLPSAVPRPTAHRMYVSVSLEECRVATAVSELEW